METDRTSAPRLPHVRQTNSGSISDSWGPLVLQATLQVAAKQRPELSVAHQNRLTYSGHFLTRPDLERNTTVYDKFHMPRHTSSGGRCSPITAYRMRHLRPGCCANHASSSVIDQFSEV